MKQVKVCLGRFAPFTLGHLKMATYKDLKGPDSEQKNALREQPDLKEIAKQKTVILAISTPQDKVDTRHPFSDNVMKEEWDLIKKNYKDEIEDVFYVKSADICAWGELLKEKGYQASVWLTGSDEYKMYKMMSMKVPEYEEKNRDNRDIKGAYAQSFYVEEIERTEDKDFVSSISGTKVRQALLDGDEELFTKMMPKGANKYFGKFKEAVENAPEPKKKPAKKKVKEGMTPLVQFIKESLDNKTIKFKGTTNKADACDYTMDKLVPKDDHNAIMNAQINSIEDLDVKDLSKQGCKYVVLVPPHTSNGNTVDYYTVRMFISKKINFGLFKDSQKLALYDLKNKEFVNKPVLDKFYGNDKTYRLD